MAALRARLPVRHRGAVAGRVAGRALPLRRDPSADAGRQGHARRDGAHLGAAGPVRAAEGGGLLAGPLRARGPQRGADHGAEVPRRPRRAAGQEHPAGHRADLRGAVLRERVPPHLGAARRRVRPARPRRDPDRRRLPGAGAAARGPPERGGQGGAVHPAEHQRDARGVRPRQGADLRVRGAGDDDQGEARRRLHHDPERAADRPGGRPADVPTAPADPRLLRLRRHPRRRPLRHRRHDARGGRRGARAERRGRAEQLDQRPHLVHPRLRPRRRVREHGAERRLAELLREQHPAVGCADHHAAARVLRRELSGLLDRGRAKGHGSRRARLSRRRHRERPAEQHLRRHGWRARWAVRSGGCSTR